MMITRGKGVWVEVEEDERGWLGTKRDFALGDGHTVQCAGDVLLSYTAWNRYGFVNQCHPDNLNKKVIVILVMVLVSILMVITSMKNSYCNTNNGDC